MNETEKREKYINEIKSDIQVVRKQLEDIDDLDETKDFVMKQRAKIQQISGVHTDRTKIETGDLDTFSTRRLEDFADLLKRTKNSKWMTKSGRDEIAEKQREALKRRGYDLSMNQLRVFQKIISDKEIQRLIEMKILSSSQVLQESLSQKNSKDLIADLKQVERAFGQKITSLSGKTVRSLIQLTRQMKEASNIKVNYNEITKILRVLKNSVNVNKMKKRDIETVLNDILKKRGVI